MPWGGIARQPAKSVEVVGRVKARAATAQRLGLEAHRYLDHDHPAGVRRRRAMRPFDG
jgi:hypothetical protein